MGVDYFNLRHLAQHYRVGVVAPCYDSFPKEGVANLESFLSGAYFWPRDPLPTATMLPEEPRAKLRSWVHWVPGRVRQWLYRRMLGVDGKPQDALEKLCILSNCAPQLLSALNGAHWQAVVLIQTNIEPWLDYLPPMGGKVVYFHDVRADYFNRSISTPGRADVTATEVAAVHQQEQQVVERADVVGFVSSLDEARANRLFPHAREKRRCVDLD